MTKVSTATEDLLRIVKAGQLCDTPTSYATSDRSPDSLTAPCMMSLSAAGRTAHDSPTLMRRASAIPRISSLQRISLRSLRISPLRLGRSRETLRESTKQEEFTPTANCNPFMTSSSRQHENALTEVRGHISALDKSSASDYQVSDIVELYTVHGGGDGNISKLDSVNDVSQALQTGTRASTTSFRPCGDSPPRHAMTADRPADSISIASTADSITPDAERGRISFDFTGEYNSLSEGGQRVSFVEQLEKFGIESADTSSATHGTRFGSLLSQATASAHKPGHGRLNRGFQFGSQTTLIVPADTAQAQTVVNRAGLTDHATSHARDNISASTLQSHLHGDSVFSFGSISSVGEIVTDGIATHIRSVFEAERMTDSAKRDAGLPIERDSGMIRPPASGVPGTSPRRVVWQAVSCTSRARLISINSVMQGDWSTAASHDSLTHRRNCSSINSNVSSAQRLGRPGIDLDRMFVVSAGSRVVSYTSSSASESLSASPASTRPTSDSLLGSFSAAWSPCSIMDSTQDAIVPNLKDSVFGSRSAATEQGFTIRGGRPISGLSTQSSRDNSDVDHGVSTSHAQGSPLANKKGMTQIANLTASSELEGVGQDESVIGEQSQQSS